MAIRLADTTKPMGDFPVAEGVDIDVEVNGKTKRLQKAIEDGDLSGGGSTIQYDILPVPSEEYEGKIVQFVGDTGTYESGAFYKCVLKDDSYVWERVEDDISGNTVTFEEPEEYTEPESKETLATIIGKVVKGIKNLFASVGDLETLETEEKTSLVGAVNEISDSLVDKAEIDDSNVSTKKTYSSQKIEDNYQRNARAEIKTEQEIKNLDVTNLQVGLNTFWCSDLTIGDYTHLYGIVEAFRRGMDLNVIVHDTVRDIHFYCAKNNGTWSAWKELATMDKVDSELKKVTKIETKYIGTSGEFQLANGVYLLTYTQFGAQNCYGMYTVFVSNYAPTTKVVKVFDSGEYPITATIDATSKKISITCATTIQVGLCSICPIGS